jgi:hypothetical protein
MLTMLSQCSEQSLRRGPIFRVTSRLQLPSPRLVSYELWTSVPRHHQDKMTPSGGELIHVIRIAGENDFGGMDSLKIFRA